MYRENEWYDSVLCSLMWFKGITCLIWENLVFVFVSQREKKTTETIEDMK